MVRVLLFLAFIGHAEAVTLTHYAYPGDSTPDTNSSNGIGNHNNTLSALTSAAVSQDIVQANHLALGQSFSIVANGQTYNLVYADSPRADLTGRIDIYDPNNALGGGNNFSQQVTSLNNGPVIDGGGGAVSAAIETINIAVVDALLSKFKQAGQSWVGPLTRGATRLFWLLAGISLVWTGAIMALKRADLSEILVELVRFIMTIGIFFWGLIHGPEFAMAIINSLRQLGGEASGSGQSVFPGDLVTMGVQVVQNQMKPMNWIFPVTSIIPALLAIIVLMVCILICASICVLLVEAWIVAYAGIIVLGFGSSKWTSDIAINYFRTALGIGLSLMTMQLVISIGITFLKMLIQATGDNGDIAKLIAITVAVVLLGVIAHRLPSMVSSMVTGSGHHGGHGAIGLMGAAGATLALVSMAQRFAGGAGMAMNAAGSAAQLINRTSVLDGSNGNSSRISPIQTMSTEATPPHPIAFDEPPGYDPNWNSHDE